MQAWLKVKRLARSGSYHRLTAIRLLLAISSALAICLVLVSGPYIQSAFVSFAAGDKSSLYGGMYEQGIGVFPSAGEYIRAAFWSPYLLCSFAIAVASVWLNTKRLFILGVTLVTFIGLTAIDLFTGDKLSIHDLAVSVTCNAVGGFIFALTSFVIASNATIVRVIANGNKLAERVLWVIWPAACYVVLASVLFFALAFIIKIPSTPVSVRMTPPVSGYFSTKNLTQCSQDESSKDVATACRTPSKISNRKDSKDDFDFLKLFSVAKDGEFKWVGASKGMSARWLKSNATTVGGDIRIVQGCMSSDQVKKMLKSPILEKVSLSQMGIEIDDGLSDFELLDPEHVGSVSVRDDDDWLSQFWIVPSGNNAAKLDAQRFVTKGSIQIEDRFREFSYAFTLYPFSAEKEKSFLKSRQLTLTHIGTAEKKSITVNFDPGLVTPDAAMKCQALKLQSAGSGYVATATEPLITLIVSVDRAEKIPYGAFDKPDQLQVSGLNGWASSDGNEKSSLDRLFQGGNLTQLAVFGALKEVQINDKSIATGPTSTLQLAGKLFGRSDGDSVIITGNADFMLLNDRRLTSTRWEDLDTGVRVPLILGIPTALYFFINLLRSALRRKMRHVWYLPS